MPEARFTGHLGFAVLVLAMIGLASAAPVTAAPPPVIGLFTNYSWEDPYIAQVKGIIDTVNPNARILDLAHSVSPASVAEGSFLFQQSSEEFPAGSIFVAIVDPQAGTDLTPVLVETAKHKFYLGPDNGMFTYVIDREGFSRAWKLDKPEYFHVNPGSHNLHGRDIFAPVAARLASGLDPERVGTAIKNLVLLPAKEATFTNGTIAVEVLHHDHFGDIVLNFRADNPIAAKLKEGNLVKISIGKESDSGPLVKSTADVEKGRLFLFYGASGLLEISVNQGSAAKELKVEPGNIIFLKP